MSRLPLLSTALVVAVAAPAVAQQSPAEQRREIMRTMSRQTFAPLAGMVKASTYDQVTVERAFAVLAENAPKLPPLWPANSPSPTTDRFIASPKIWQNKADFDANLAKLISSVPTLRAQALEGAPGLKTALATLDRTCNGCHETYRERIR